MGLIRFTLAFAVVLWHSGPFLVVSGYFAVLCFFAISGFYMSMIINTAYSRSGENWKARFYSSRALRIFPVYWFVAALSIVFWYHTRWPGPDLLNNGNEISGLAKAGLVFANVAILGLDVVAITKSHVTGTVMRLVGPAWSLSIELQFYLAAPFIVTRSFRSLAVLTFLLIALRLALQRAMGALSFRLLEHVPGPATRRLMGWIGLLGIAPLAVWCGIRDITADLDTPAMWGFYAFMCLTLPFIFDLTKDWRLDRSIGELSYPLYIVHPLVIQGIWHYYGTTAHWTALVGGSLLAAVAIHLALERPIERIRARLRGAIRPATLGTSDYGARRVNVT